MTKHFSIYYSINLILLGTHGKAQKAMLHHYKKGKENGELTHIKKEIG